MNKKKLYISLIVISIVFLSIGGTFALVTSTMNGINITQIKSGNLTLSIDGGGSIDASLVPAKCTSENAIKKKIVAKATNTSGGKVSFSLGLDITSISDSFKRNTMRYMLTTNENGCSTGIISGGNFKDKSTGDEVWLVKNDYDNITKSGNTYTKTYYLYIWLDEYETEYIEGNISVKIKGTTSNEPNLTTEASKTISLYDYMKDNADTTTTVDFSQTSETSSTNGIYTTTETDSGNPVYYYRGAVDNNVLFANFCWKIIRTTETGGVKLIYNGVPSNGECNNMGEDSTIGKSVFNSGYSDAKYVGYMYGDSIDDTANTNDSTIKTFIDAWYQNNMTSYTSQLEDTIFCNDRSYTIDSGFYFGAYTRLHTNKQPTLKCQNVRDKFTVNASNGNGNLTYPVGLITADEVAYAGGSYQSSNYSYYLYNEDYQWTFSPYDYVRGFAWGFSVAYFVKFSTYYTYGGLDYNAVATSYGTRPVISLKPGTVLASGSGTTTDPFVIN